MHLWPLRFHAKSGTQGYRNDIEDDPSPISFVPRPFTDQGLSRILKLLSSNSTGSSLTVSTVKCST